jgi:leucyl-tRNA synthetase
MAGNKYNPAKIEQKWQERWAAGQLYRSSVDWSRPKHYALTMLPYPSGDLHIGHWFAMTPADARARFMRMNGYNVLFPMGFDAFGLPAENAAIQRNIHPKAWTSASIERMRQQLRSMGTMFDWKREAVSCDPSYYHWTEWFFKRFYEHGLAYRGKALVNWSPTLQTVLANEQVIDGKDERTGQPVVQKMMAQWFFRITQYADELLDFGKLDWPDPVNTMQTHWIGRSEGARVTFTTEQEDPIEIFTTRPDTLWGATFMVLAPEHPLVDKITTIEHRQAVSAYQEETARATELERAAEQREKSGVFTGGYAINPVNAQRIPIWIADYVLITYGSGAIMAVPAHDERDFDFALKFGLPILPVIARPDGLSKSYTRLGAWVKAGFAEALEGTGFQVQTGGDEVYVTMPAEQTDAYVDLVQQYLQPGSWTEVVGGRWIFIFEDGPMAFDSLESDRKIMDRCRALEPALAGKRTVMEMLWDVEWYRDVLFHDQYGEMINSGPFSGTPGRRDGSDEAVEPVAKTEVTTWLQKQGFGQKSVNYRLRDWLISRQRYWGAPIPIVYKADKSMEAVPDEDLPILLPDDVGFMPSGQSPLRFHAAFLNTADSAGKPATRETDTLDTFMCSSWYQYRYLSPDYDRGPFDPEEAAYWLPVDVYTGGAEHATLHLLYTRFFTKAMRDLGLFGETAEAMRAHGRDPEGLFDEPMTLLRNQGQVLGEERRGDYVLAYGRLEDNRLLAERVEVITPKEAPATFDGVQGEIVRRTENVLTIDAGDETLATVEILPEATVEIPTIPGKNNVNQLRHHLDVQRMSKSKGNVVNPDELVKRYGADTVRAYLMFFARWEHGGPWNSQAIEGTARWLRRLWDLFSQPPSPGQPAPEVVRALRRKVHQTLGQVTHDFETFEFNTIISGLMELLNHMQQAADQGAVGGEAWTEAQDIYVRMLAPVTPHIAEELWTQTLGKPYSVHQQPWPELDETATEEETLTIVVQVNGKLRDRITVPADIGEEEAKALALNSEGAQRNLNGKMPTKIIYVPGRLVNLVVK